MGRQCIILSLVENRSLCCMHSQEPFNWKDILHAALLALLDKASRVYNSTVLTRFLKVICVSYHSQSTYIWCLKKLIGGRHLTNQISQWAGQLNKKETKIIYQLYNFILKCESNYASMHVRSTLHSAAAALKGDLLRKNHFYKVFKQLYGRNVWKQLAYNG